MAGHPESAGPRVDFERIAKLGLATAAIAFGAFLIAAVGWYRSSRSPRLELLTSEERQTLVQGVLDDSPGVHRWTYFEPRIGFTLRPNARLEAWGDTFKSNGQGFRTRPLEKKEGVFRIVFLGDSWTFGMGIKENETFAKEVARLANEHAGLDYEVEEWILAVPGWNCFNEIAALWFLFDRLQPDAIVWTFSGNDNHSTFSVLPNGSTLQNGALIDQFGDRMNVVYQARRIDSYRYQSRWQQIFDAVADTQQQLGRLGVPLSFFFLGRWPETDAHSMVARSDLNRPYTISPVHLTQGEWKSRYGHGSVEANALYARMVYRLLASTLGWDDLPDGGDVRAEVEIYDRPPQGKDWLAAYKEDTLEVTEQAMFPSFVPNPKRRSRQIVGPMSALTGHIGRSSGVIVRRAQGATHLQLKVSRVAEIPSLYPLELELSIPSPSGGSRAFVTVPADGPGTYDFRVPIPDDLEEYSALDFFVFASKTASLGNGAVSVKVESVANWP